MSKDHLGLFDTPAGRRQIRLAFAIVALMVAASLVLIPMRNVRISEIGAFIPTVDSLLFAVDLITALLLFAQAAVFRSRALSALASGYLLGALLIVPHALTFPGAFAPDGLLGAGVNSTAWLATVQRIAFPIAVILYVLLGERDSASRRDLEPSPRIGAWAFGALLLAAGITLLATIGHDLLPPYFADRAVLLYSSSVLYQAVAFLILMIAAVMLFRTRRSLLDIWLLVALGGWFSQSILITLLGERFTVGFYSLFVLLLVSHLVVTLALLAEYNRLYAGLATATAARTRERDARMRSMEAVTAAISHEVGQPIAGAILNARNGIGWLDRDRPEVAKAIESLRYTIDAGHQAMDLMKSLRANFAKGIVSTTEFNLNDLVRETASCLNLELAGEDVALELSLDEGLAPIVADRIQIQRVIVNLFINAIESLGATRGRARRIEVRSAPLDDRAVVLEVRDCGIGIAPDEMPQIFDAFFTTKETGTGLGLSLCRTIVEEHGGRLWASPGDEHGATFHLQLPIAA